MFEKTLTIELDPDWTVCRRFVCGHTQHACCRNHLDDVCPKCAEEK